MVQRMSNLKASMVTVYGETDRIEIAGTGDQFKLPVAQILSGQLGSLTGSALPFSMAFNRGEHSGPGMRREK
jgi:hypothetical protein